MILGWSFYAIGRLRPQIAYWQSFPLSLRSLPFRWMDLHLSMILLLEDSPIPATGNSFAQSDGFTWVHIRREHFLSSIILFRMASKPITWLYKKVAWSSLLNCGAVSLLSCWQQQHQTQKLYILPLSCCIGSEYLGLKVILPQWPEFPLKLFSPNITHTKNDHDSTLKW